MFKFTLLIAFAVLSVVAFTGVSATNINLGPSANGTQVNVANGDHIEITLQGNPTTGNQWRTDYIQGPSVVQAGAPVYKPNGPHHGAGGNFIFPYNAVSQGTTTIVLEYGRNWVAKPTDFFVVTLNVQH